MKLETVGDHRNEILSYMSYADMLGHFDLGNSGIRVNDRLGSGPDEGSIKASAHPCHWDNSDLVYI